MKTVLDWQRMKQVGEKIVVATCYSYWAAQIYNDTAVDCLLVGDSVAMVEHGYTSTLQATTEMMARHTDAVVRGAPEKMVVADLPFMSYRKGLMPTMQAVEDLMRQGAHAVKLEGAGSNCETIKHIVESGVPVMGHLGLTPQSVNQMGGYKVQGRGQQAADALIESALQLEQAGCFSVVLECVPSQLAQRVTQALSVPTIGIGAGVDTDGQVLVFHDMLGLNQFNAKFIKRYMNGREQILDALERYQQEVVSRAFPQPEHCFD